MNGPFLQEEHHQCSVDDLQIRLMLGWTLIAVEPLTVMPPRYHSQPPLSEESVSHEAGDAS
jgi:hypothetical protein